MERKAIAALMLASLALSACVSEEEMATKRQMAQANREKQCTSFGYKLGTPNYGKCLESLYLQDQQLAAAEEANRQTRLHEFGQRLQRASEAMKSANPPTVHCTTTPNGIGGTNTTCQ
ncbi:hypothetical protein ABH973_002616 [Bradyrhizobium ottawaense]|uniref:hypothetical protein n=1 Tax=Bradyrhizobium ottawaense TaxID=931866 RepID=UPI003515845A